MELKNVCLVGFTVALLIFTLNIVDAIATHEIVFLGNGDVIEASPIMQFAMDKLGSLWMVPKILIVTLGVSMFAFNWDSWYAKFGGALTLIIYTGIILHHINGIHGLIHGETLWALVSL